jgi:amidase
MEPIHNAVLMINPDAVAIAKALDQERSTRGVRGPLHGIPILVKDNLDTGCSMPTTAGSLALAGTRASADSTVVARLRNAGAVVLGKTNLSEWANFRSTRSSSGWSSVGGQTRNAHDPLRTPGGSSSGSGVAVALGYCAGAIGTETDGSIVGPSSMNGVVGIKPSLGLVSRAGIVPIAASQDTAGPMTRTVRDGAIVLAAIAGADPADSATSIVQSMPLDFETDLQRTDLHGIRIGIARGYAGFHDRVDAVFESAIVELRAAGVEIIDDVDLTPADVIRPHERVVMEYEFKHGLQRYLATRDNNTKVRTLEDVIAFNRRNASTVMPHFAQEILEQSQCRGTLIDAHYRHAREQSLILAAREGIDTVIGQHRLDALLAPTASPAWLIDWVCGDNRRGGAACPAAVAGYPHVTVPMGYVEHLPVGLSFFAGAFSDREVIRIAHTYEVNRGHLEPPRVRQS